MVNEEYDTEECPRCESPTTPVQVTEYLGYYECWCTHCDFSWEVED